MNNNTNISPVGESWESYRKTLLTEEERKEIDIKVQLITEIINARQERGITQKQLEEASGVRQPIIARLEKGKTDPQLSTILKILKAFGKTLAIVPIKK